MAVQKYTLDWAMIAARVRIDGSTWNQGNQSKCEKRGVSAATVEALFGGELLPDPAHSKSEERFKAIGRTGQGLFVVFTFRK
jgi:uncharacterized protein